MSRCKDCYTGKLSVSGGSLIHASNDAMIRMVATGAGALVMSSDRLVDEVERRVTEYRVEAAMAMVNRENRREGLRNNRLNVPVMQGAKGFGSRSVGLSEVDGKQVVNTFRGGQFIIEDKRKKGRNVTPRIQSLRVGRPSLMI
ncbi:LOW QUALITY PROTEIN: hypothetical protein ACHAW5_004561 [Stephanodiscus triporus]|uniref:Uncharacterized protein n=1 Tax=Stephanodiscus triporus TaxID=2934178 RepID=A0ABD3NZU9_9STRA